MLQQNPLDIVQSYRPGTFYSGHLKIFILYILFWEMHVIQCWRIVVYCMCCWGGCSMEAIYSPNSSSELFRFEQREQTTARYPDSGLNCKTTKFSCACSIEVDTPLRAPDWAWKFRNSRLLQQPLLCVWSNLEKLQWMHSFRMNSAIRPESIWLLIFFQQQ